jgi:hypothetical protein
LEVLLTSSISFTQLFKNTRHVKNKTELNK